MDGHIGHLRCHLRLVGDPIEATATGNRLNELGHQSLSRAFSEALDTAVGNDPTVYVFRRVDCRFSGRLPAQDDVALSRTWGRQFAAAVVAAIADPSRHELIRFADQSEYVACFIAEALAGTASSRWYFGAFSAAKGRPLADALSAVLFDNIDVLWQVLAHLYRRGLVPRLLRTLDAATVETLWAQGMSEERSDNPDQWYPFVAVAVSMFDALGLWSGSRPDATDLARAFASTGPASPDWKDRQSLADAVSAIFGWLYRSNGLGRTSWRDDDLRLVLHPLLAELDWLDGERLLEGVTRALVSTAAGLHGRGLPRREEKIGPTPRQAALLADLLTALEHERPTVDAVNGSSSVNAMAVFAALAKHAPCWASDEAARRLVHRLLTAWAAIASAPMAFSVLEALASGDADGAPALLGCGPEGRAAVESVISLGPPAVAVFQALQNAAPQAPRAAAPISTGCAGIFLLLRAVFDARLVELSAALDYPSAPSPTESGMALLAALALRWAGPVAVTKADLDPGVGVFARIPFGPAAADPSRSLAPDTLLDAFAPVPEEDHHRWQERLLTTLVGQRLMDHSALRLHRVPFGTENMALVGADSSGQVWPLGRLVEPTAATSPQLGWWAQAWERATGTQPASLEIVNPGVDDRGRPALLDALAALSAGHLGLTAADLALDLTAMALLRLWARWLRGFAASSLRFLLDSFVRRPGHFVVDDHEVVVTLEPRPLDVVLRLAGYLSPITPAASSQQRQVRFLVEEE